jgi:hypothetical protein
MKWSKYLAASDTSTPSLRIQISTNARDPGTLNIVLFVGLIIHSSSNTD